MFGPMRLAEAAILFNVYITNIHRTIVMNGFGIFYVLSSPTYPLILNNRLNPKLLYYPLHLNSLSISDQFIFRILD